MTVFVVYQYYGWDGNTEPKAVFSTYEKARDWVDSQKKYENNYIIDDHEVDIHVSVNP